jgi:hypothetical protein
MEKELDNLEINKICMIMRAIELFQKSQDNIGKLREINKEYKRLCSVVHEFMRNLTDEQRDKVLDVYKIKLKYRK